MNKNNSALNSSNSMWKYFSGILLRNKLAFTIGVLLLTVFMGYEASKMQLSYEFAKILPDTDSTFIEYQNFKKKFGEEPIFVNLKDGRSGSADIANEKFLQWKNENLKSKEAWLDRERSAGKTSGLDELKKELNEIIDEKRLRLVIDRLCLRCKLK
jgi:hypothetical protein